MSAAATASSRTDPTTVARRLARSQRLARRRFELLPLIGPGAAFTEVQGRLPGASTTPEGLAELISSIATVGVLQPILVEELPDGRRRLVSGERRLRAAKWLATDQTADERFQTIPAICCPGPLSEEERRVWQLVENLAREDLRPGELAAALLYERCAVLAAKLLAAGVSIPNEVTALEDPVARFRALDRLRLRSGHARMGAPWEEVLRRLGIQLGERKAQQLARAFATLPQDLSAEMDAAKVALHTRLRYLKLDQGNRAAARDIWEALHARRDHQLLAAAVHARLDQPELSTADAILNAEAIHQAANEARTRQGLAAASEVGDAGSVKPEMVAEAIASLKGLLGALLKGAVLAERDAGTLRICLEEALSHIVAPVVTTIAREGAMRHSQDSGDPTGGGDGLAGAGRAGEGGGRSENRASGQQRSSMTSSMQPPLALNGWRTLMSSLVSTGVPLDTRRSPARVSRRRGDRAAQSSRPPACNIAGDNSP